MCSYRRTEAESRREEEGVAADFSLRFISGNNGPLISYEFPFTPLKSQLVTLVLVTFPENSLQATWLDPPSIPVVGTPTTILILRFALGVTQT